MFVKIYNISNGMLLSTYANGNSQPDTLSFSRISPLLLAIGYTDGTLVVLSGVSPFGVSPIFVSQASGVNNVVAVDFDWTTQQLLICKGGGNTYRVLAPNGTTVLSGTANNGNIVACKFDKNGGIGIVSAKLNYYPAGTTSSNYTNNTGYASLDFRPVTGAYQMVVGMSGGSGKLELISITTSTTTNPYTTSTGSSEVICYSKDANFVTIGGTGKFIYILNATNNNYTNIQLFRDSPVTLTACRFSYDTNYLAVGNSGGTVYIYSTLCNAEKCAQGFYTNATGGCSSCAVMLGCWTCSSGTVCIDCYEGFYNSTGSCLSCNIMEACTACTNSTACLECNTGYYLDNVSTNLCFSC